MNVDRRGFLRTVGAAGCGLALAGERAFGELPASPGDGVGVLVDIPKCIGCRKCEYACREAAGFDVPPMETFEDKLVFAEHRRPMPDSFTVVNAFDNPRDETRPIYAKVNCLHCLDPACVSACLVGALRREGNGAVTYDAWKCMGCRYCMVACPFQIPTYEYDNALAPQVRKCTFCFDKLASNGGVPACVKICPQECLTFGKRSDLLSLAREKIRAEPDVYEDHIYGEHEAGGTSWLYLSSVPFERLAFLVLGPEAPPRLTEAIQHGVFKHWMPPLAWYGLLATIMWLTRRGSAAETEGEEKGHAEPTGERRPSGLRRKARIPHEVEATEGVPT